MTELHFAEPSWVHLLWAVAAYAGIMSWLEARHGAALERFAGTVLLERLVRRPSQTQRRARILLLAAAGTFMTLALMRPQWGIEMIATPRAGAEIMICLDVSNSMLAEDVAPNRLERAKAEIRDLLELLDGDQVGLIAFAGRASILSPLTPDFGFLRLVLDSAGPGSVTRGGTRLEEPVRKAVDGFAHTSDVSRSIILITDGEDHDSFPLEAAKKAAERGIRILAIGFGDEKGASIQVTDPATGAQILLKGADGKPVRTRLDGELLREMALATQGAYIPAGTGVLDLATIYQAHIAPLTRGQLDGKTRAVRTDAYQWALVLALLSLFGALTVTVQGATRRGLVSMAAATMFIGAPAEHTRADNETSREVFNAGLTAAANQAWEDARAKFEQARTRAQADGELRYRATYGLGWTTAQEADHLIETAPQKALAKLEESAVWFRESLELRPGADEARYNLELIEQRIVELADSLREKNKETIRGALEALIEQQRKVLSQMAFASTAIRGDGASHATREAQRVHRDLSAQALGIVEEARTLTERARRELASLEAKAEKERSSDDLVRMVGIAKALTYLHAAQTKLNGSRRQLRRLRTIPAYHRGAGALDALKRALDQLLDPVERIDALLRQTRELVALTRIYSLEGRALESAPPIPEWLTSDHLVENQAVLLARAEELATGFANALGAPAPPSTKHAATEERLRAQLEAATPYLRTASTEFRHAKERLDNDAAARALAHQGTGYGALLEARELFLDIRRLINLIYETEVPIIEALDTGTAKAVSPRDLASAHERNLTRMTRLGRMITDSLAEGSADAEPKPGPEQQRLERGYEFWREAKHKMHTVQQGMVEDRAETEAGAEVVSLLGDLRRLFFNLVEHLKETARRQAELADETARLATIQDVGEGQTGPLAARQGQLAETASALGQGLEEQALGAGEQKPALDDAARLVNDASTAMDTAAKSMTEPTTDLTDTQAAQEAARSKLEEAIARLEPPKDNSSDEQEQGQDSTDGGQSQTAGPQDRGTGGNMEQLLQGVRDREAERRRARAQRQSGYAPVEKDW